MIMEKFTSKNYVYLLWRQHLYSWLQFFFLGTKIDLSTLSTEKVTTEAYGDIVEKKNEHH